MTDKIMEALEATLNGADMQHALSMAVLRDPMRAIELLARLRSLGMLGSAAADLSDAELAKIAAEAVASAKAKKEASHA